MTISKSYSDKEVSIPGVILGKTTHPWRYVKAHAHVGVQGSRNRLRRPGAETNYTYFPYPERAVFPFFGICTGCFSLASLASLEERLNGGE